MNRDLFRYKLRFISIALIFGYAFMHVKLTGVYDGATLDEMINFTARLPFGQRMLVPALARGLSYILPIGTDQLFFLLELLFVSSFFIALFHLLRTEFSIDEARLLSWFFLLLLPLMSIINYRFTIDGEASFFYPADSASLFFMTMGFLFCVKEQWRWLVPLIFIATFNRESSILLVLLIPALHWQQLKKVQAIFGLALITYLLARLLIVLLTYKLPGTYSEFYFRDTSHTHFEANLLWLLEDNNLLFFIYCLCGLPLFWFGFHDYIPPQYQPIRYVALIYFIGLLLVGHFMEARIFNELLILLYIPVSIAVSRWVSGRSPFISAKQHWLYFADRYAVLVILVAIVVGRAAINPWVLWFAAN
ncbi:hypothetical protein Lqui_0759 [Legionella quinlivanii]|uniref:Transmembrane protein n=1 Tax=Legionella quinlivanii TaxID=45073 RepID=A0A0W0Y4L2_9GAMM|nr:hypothetical protein [Legionella quinlivanii]KTD51915.1 hypothetical protein Lqui_0759 [Legionella quinlivanii]SEF84709.1 hypothetical protein SAMN02746093_01220 [Legionella quinlivanii DSM 21216]STY09622.1 Uncharacterised protein [Legionella quinlivanii]